MSEKLIEFGVGVRLNEKDLKNLSMLEKQLITLTNVYKAFLDNVNAGKISLSDNIVFGDKKYTRQQFEGKIQDTRRILDEARKVLNSDKSFAEYFKKYNENLNIIHNNIELYNKLENKNTEEAKRLLKEVRNAKDRNRRIRSNTVGIFDFKSYERDINETRKRKGYYAAGKEQLASEKKATKEALSNAISSYSSLYKEREAITKGLGKLSDASTKYATDAKKRLEAIDSEMSDIVNKWSGNKDFDRAKASAENKATSANIVSGLNEQYKDEHKSLANRMSDVRLEMGRIALRYHQNGMAQQEYMQNMRKLTTEYDTLKKAMKDVNKASGMGGIEKFGANIKSHLHWLISGALVDRIAEIPRAIQETTIEFDNLERKIAQNIELSGDFVNNHDALKAASRDLVYAAFDIANYHGMKVEEVLEMEQIMSRRFKDPAELKYYTNLAATMSKLDFVEPAVAAESLEAIILSFGLNARQASAFVNEFSIATHTMRINGQDLLEALQRSAPMLKQWGMTTSDSVALISTLSTTLGREGKYIGNAITGMFSRMLNKKNVSFFKEIGITMEKSNGEAKTGIEILNEYIDRYKTLSQAARKEEVNKIFGAYRVTPAMSWFDLFETFTSTRENIDNKASDEMTKKLEQEQIDSLESKINRYNNSIKILSYVIGDALAPAVADVLGFITELINKLIEWDRVHDGTIEGILAFVATLFSWIGVIKLINAALGTNLGLVNIARFSFDKLKTVIGSLEKKMWAASVMNDRYGRTFLGLGGKIGVACSKLARAGIILAAVIGLMEMASRMIDNSDNRGHIENYVASQGGWDNLSAKDPFHQQLLEFRKNEKLYKSAVETSSVEGSIAGNELATSGKIKDQSEVIKEQDKQASLLASEIIARKRVDRFGEMIDMEKPATNGYPYGDVGTKEEDKEDKKFDKGTKMVLDAKTSKYKTDEEIAKKRFDSAIEDVNYEEELLGKTPKTIMNRIHLRTNRKKELLDQYALINADINTLNDKLDKLKGKGDEDEAINDKGETTTTAKLRATYSKALDELRKLAVENEEARKDIVRSIRKSYEVAFDKQIEEEKKRNETTKKLTLLSVDNKRNAWNDATKNNVELEHERKNNAILVKDYENSVSKREELESKLFHLRVMSATEIARIGKESYEEKVKEMERELQIARDLEAEKLLLKEESDKKIEELEYKQTQKIREGLHNVVQELLLEGKSWKDIWKQLWTDLANEALRALMGIQDGSQSVLGALAANLGGLDGSGGKAKAAQGKGGKAKVASVAASAYGGNTLGLEYAGGWISHDGSIIGVTPLNTRYYHNGGNVGTSVVPYLKSDEVNAVLQTGEEVVSRKDRRSNELMSEQNKHMADAMQRMAEGSNTNVTFAIQAIDSKSVVQLLSENGDAIMNILRKQSAYGNGRI